MCEECAGCSNRSVPELFECLFSTFGEIAYRGLEKNEDNMKQLQDLETLVKVVFNCIKKATLIAAQGNDEQWSSAKALLTEHLELIEEEDQMHNDFIIES